MNQKQNPVKISKKDIRETVYNKLAAALAEYKNMVKEKRFDTNLKKASKLFADDITKAANKARKTTKKTAKVKKEESQDQPTD
jgi:hypothetical protein